MLKIADRTFTSRLLTGTGKFPSPEAMRDALVASGAEMVTVALRRAYRPRGLLRQFMPLLYLLNTFGLKPVECCL